MRHLSYKLLLACSVAAFAATGCDGNGNGRRPDPQPPTGNPSPTGFTSFSKQVFAADSNGQPADVESVTFSFDSDQDPTAYDDILPTS